MASPTSPNMSDTEKQRYDNAVGTYLELDEISLSPTCFPSKLFIGPIADIGLGLIAGVVRRDTLLALVHGH